MNFTNNQKKKKANKNIKTTMRYLTTVGMAVITR